ncbi:MAG: MFS transporter, partial [Candidatus Scatosoma sp.]
GTFYFFAYGIGQVVNGLLCKRYNKKYCIAASLFISAAINAVLFFSPAFSAYKWLWLVNGAALSVLWSSLVAILAENLNEKYLRRGVLVMSMSVAAGTCITYGAGAVFNELNVYRLSFMLAAVLAAGFAVAWVISFDALTSAGIAEKSDVKNAAGQNGGRNGGEAAPCRKSAADKAGKKQPIGAWNAFYVLAVPGLLAAVVNLIKDGLNTWVPQILKSEFGYGNGLSVALTLVLPLVGMGGAATALFFNKKIKDFTALSGVLYIGCTLCTAGITGVLRAETAGVAAGILTIALFGIISLFAHAINNVLTSIAPMTLREKYDSGMLAGVLNGCAYVGSTVSAYGLGALADKAGWNGVFILLLCISAAATLLSFAVYLCGRRMEKRRSTVNNADKTEIK